MASLYKTLLQPSCISLPTKYGASITLKIQKRKRKQQQQKNMKKILWNRMSMMIYHTPTNSWIWSVVCILIFVFAKKKMNLRWKKSGKRILWLCLTCENLKKANYYKILVIVPMNLVCDKIKYLIWIPNPLLILFDWFVGSPRYRHISV